MNKDERDPFVLRLIVILLIFLISFVAIFGRLLYLQVFHRDYYVAGMLEQTAPKIIDVKGERGDILDRNGVAIAISKPSYELDINPALLTNSQKILLKEKLPQILNVSEKDIENILTYKVFVRVSISLTNSQKSQIEQLGITKGIAITPTEQRVYPFHSLLSDALGFVGSDDKGLAGIEYKFDSDLKGIDGRVYLPKVSPKPIIPNVSMFKIKPIKGDTLELTIDSNIQYTIEQYLKEAVIKNKAKDGVIIVMNPRSGEILGMASYPNFDPNSLSSINSNDLVNRAIQMNYEPGSVLKPIIAAAALQEGTLHTDDTFECKGSLRVKDRVLHCWRTHGIEHGLNVIMRNSCDVAFMKIGLKLGKEQLVRYLQRFGFGEYTGVELPGEEKGILPDVRDLGDVEVATMSYGQGVAVTPLQLIDAFCAIANHGVEMKPYIVKKIIGPDGKVKYTNTPMVRKVVVSNKVAAEVMDALKAVVSPKGVPQAEVKGYTVAGKTGTAQKADKSGYSNTKLIYSFCGIVPASDPQVVILTVIDETEKPTYSLYVAAPLFQKVASFLVKYLKIPPDNLPNQKGEK
jgi:stage V sporulation protein D (sporulation-specific penicillin-binding protein)